MRSYVILAAVVLMIGAPQASATDFTVLAYHDIVDDPGALTYDAITTRVLATHFDWLRANGYRVISVDDIVAAERGDRPLPPRSVLLTFDDGYRSFYTRAFPLLLAFDYPAVLSVVGSFLEAPPRAQVRYGGDLVAREDFVSWAQLREMQASGLVEIGSHSYALHTTIYSNPQGGETPAATGRALIRRNPGTQMAGGYRALIQPPRLDDIAGMLRSPFSPLLELSIRLTQTALDYAYDPATGRYETDAEYAKRIRTDLERNSALLGAKLERRPRVMTWPFGRWSEATVEIARQVGMPVALTLDPEPADTREIHRIGRFYATNKPDLAFLPRVLRLPPDPPLIRGVCASLDEMYAPTVDGREERLGRVLDALLDFKPNVVLLSVASSEEGPLTVYFPAEGPRVRADMFNRAAWQIRTRVGTDVYAWLPIEKVGPDPATVRTVYAEMGKVVPFAGLGLGQTFLAGDLKAVPVDSGLNRWDPRIPRRVRAAQELAGLSARARLELAAIDAVSRYQPIVSVLDVVPLDRLRPPSQVAADAVDSIGVVWSGRADDVVRTLGQLGWLDPVYRPRIVPFSAQADPRQWRRLQQAGLVNGIYCPERVLDQTRALHALSEVLGASTNPFRR
jgi:poly-beta-1,6-N-acetyl-D-glucosamine N-deacetylase